MGRDEIDLDEYRAELERTSLMRQEFTANASHELKTPLHVISGYAELLESGMVREEDIKVFAGKIRAEAMRMTKLVEDIIALSRLDSGGVGMKRELVDLYKVAASAVEALTEAARTAEVEISLCPAPERPVLLRGIPHALYSTVYNLCENAVKYNVPGGKVSVTVETSEDGAAVLTVSDTGIGIPQEDLQRIFERFYRVDKSHSKEVGGTGLGLSIVKHAAMTHNARIEVDSEVGRGSAFTVRFP